MKTRFNTYDIVCAVFELQSLIGHRVNQIYDVDNKTYLIRLQNGEKKKILLIESGIRFHTTDYEWPKNSAPSGFSMKLRKHLKNKRLEKIEQLGVDRIVDFQFGSQEAAYHVIVELFDRGNVILTDYQMVILYVLRPHVEGENEEMRFAVKEKYPLDRAKKEGLIASVENVTNLISNADDDNLRRVLVPALTCGPAVIDHVLTKHNLSHCVLKVDKPTEEKDSKSAKTNVGKNKKKQLNSRDFDIENDLPNLVKAIEEANEIVELGRRSVSKGYIIQAKEEKPSVDNSKKDYFYKNLEYHPYLFAQFKDFEVANFETFMQAVDEFYSKLESQKIDIKAVQQEKEAIKKLQNVKNDHVKRLEQLAKNQESDKQKAELIKINQVLVDKAIMAVRSAIASQMSWTDIRELVKNAQQNNDPVAMTINQLKLETNMITLKLSDEAYFSEDDDEAVEKAKSQQVMHVDIDLNISAWANARKYYDQKRMAAQKEQKTIDASQKALKSAEKKTQILLKDVQTKSSISKARKVFWFEKFYWFVSSENYLVIGGRDAQQNELIVKRYMRPSDIYVHAEIQGASSVVIRNPSGNEVPPKTLLEAGTMAISYSVAWDAKVVTNAYWVYSNQVSKKAPTGEYLSTGSFMIRGKKNFLPPCQLVLGASLLFKLEDSFIARHKNERRVRVLDDNEKEEMPEESAGDGQLETLSEGEENEGPTEAEQADVAPGEKDLDVEEDKENLNFPDTEVKIEHDTGRVMINRTESEPGIESNSATDPLLYVDRNAEGEEITIIPAAVSRQKQQKAKKKPKKGEDSKKGANIKSNEAALAEDGKSTAQVKRGQKSKMKKLKSKYRDQDEEERMLRMKILNSSGKDTLPADGGVEKLETALENADEDSSKNANRQRAKKEITDEADDVDDLTQPAADVEMLDSLTGQPFDDDELLFIIPVVAPYQALHNYKYKIKLTPGTGKRGKAAKMALMMFSKEKSCSAYEKDLIKSVKEESLARNMPGKVKFSAPQLQKIRR